MISFTDWLKNLLSFERPANLQSQFARFAFTGALTAGLDFLLLILLVERFSIQYLLAGGVSFVAAVALNYVISRAWVFKGSQYSLPTEFLGFFATSGLGLGLNQLILWVFVGSLSIDYRISKAVSILAVTFWNYVSKKYFVFRDPL
jgi:putative flippase GtrA